MALSPLLNVPITRQDTTIDVVRKGDGDQPFDEVVSRLRSPALGRHRRQRDHLILPLAGTSRDDDRVTSRACETGPSRGGWWAKRPMSRPAARRMMRGSRRSGEKPIRKKRRCTRDRLRPVAREGFESPAQVEGTLTGEVGQRCQLTHRPQRMMRTRQSTKGSRVAGDGGPPFYLSLTSAQPLRDRAGG